VSAAIGRGPGVGRGPGGVARAQWDGERAPRGNRGRNVRGLLDHIAAELAEEYIRLMEGAAEAEAGAPGADGGAIGGEER